MLKYAVAATVLLGLTATSAPAIAGPPDSESAPQIRQQMDQQPDQRTTAGEAAPEQGEPNSYPDRAPALPPKNCPDCAPRKHYDNVEVVKSHRDVDRSRVINTESVVEVPPRQKEYNKLIVHENETRNVGVIQHNHRIIEKEIRYVRRVPVYRTRVIERVQPVIVPAPQPCGCCSCGGGLIGALTGHHGGYGYAPNYGYGYGYGYAAPPVATQRVLVPMDVPVTYGYR